MEALDLADFTLVAIITKINKTIAEKAVQSSKGFVEKLTAEFNCKFEKMNCLMKYILDHQFFFFLASIGYSIICRQQCHRNFVDIKDIGNLII